MKRVTVRNGSHPGGFTLVELVMILLVMGVVTAVAAGQVTTDDYDLIGRTEVLKAHLRHAQARAMNTDVVWGVEFDSDNHYWLFKNGDPEDKAMLPGENSLTVDLAAFDLSVAEAGTGMVLSFDGWGRPCTDAGANTPQAEGDGWRTITLTSDEDNRVVKVYNNTGYIP